MQIASVLDYDRRVYKTELTEVGSWYMKKDYEEKRNLDINWLDSNYPDWRNPNAYRE
ncbi:hypothetical protein HY061_02485 [Candidatus Azambacteria bacterium]|nr:hypothetical protein [Candidatus Azambacteria bacterium]